MQNIKLRTAVRSSGLLPATESSKERIRRIVKFHAMFMFMLEAM
jgi:hypothetical protein